MTNKISNPVNELEALQARQAALILQAERDARETADRITALFQLQEPIHEMLQERYQLRRRMARCAAFHNGFAADAIAARKTWHLECQNLARDPLAGRTGLHWVHDSMVRAESCAAECLKSLNILADDLSELEGRILGKAKDLKLEGIMPPQFPQDVLDE